ncbi:hypothetical protein L208DRAFT_1396992 [Tricholoma matsutake]|nr:hypothetical protein L208DRAFT_1396992 [Tricholoma matsutake 945]
MTLRSTNERWLPFNDDVGTAKSREMYSKHVAITLKEPCYLTMTACVQSVVPIPRPLSLPSTSLEYQRTGTFSLLRTFRR